MDTKSDVLYGTQRRRVRADGQKLHQDGFLSHLKVRNVQDNEGSRMTPIVFVPHLQLLQGSLRSTYESQGADKLTTMWRATNAAASLRVFHICPTTFMGRYLTRALQTSSHLICTRTQSYRYCH